MAREAFCTRCQRTVYIDNGGSDSCPVCSTPLVDQTTEPQPSASPGS